ncbi:hypothetical protein [Sphingomonas endolithica]|uniref:hypothetical protein n=1 Tax=Sphingomonas endolithica TaxID=2972485 RepID=UPI0021AE9378|nr:hypothetical protein [Sphingomonas sp. ZFBP2030]
MADDAKPFSRPRDAPITDAALGHLLNVCTASEGEDEFEDISQGMNTFSPAKLGRGGTACRWLFEPSGEVSKAGRTFLLGQLLGAPLATLMGAICALTVTAVALLRSGGAIYSVFVGLEVTLLAWRLIDWGQRKHRSRREPRYVPTIDGSALLSALWCTLEGMLAVAPSSIPMPFSVTRMGFFDTRAA